MRDRKLKLDTIISPIGALFVISSYFIPLHGAAKRHAGSREHVQVLCFYHVPVSRRILRKTATKAIKGLTYQAENKVLCLGVGKLHVCLFWGLFQFSFLLVGNKRETNLTLSKPPCVSLLLKRAGVCRVSAIYWALAAHGSFYLGVLMLLEDDWK